MKKLAIVSIFIAGLISLGLGRFIGFHITENEDTFLASIKSTVNDVSHRDDIDETSELNMYGKPIPDESSKDAIMSFKTQVEERCANRQVKVKEDPKYKYNYIQDDYNDWQDLLYRIYAQIRQESTAEDYEKFVSAESAWNNQILTESINKQTKSGSTLEKEYNYYSNYVDEIATRCQYLVMNKLK